MMRRRLTKKVLSTVKEMMTKDQERYATFWREFGTVLKEGLVTDSENRDALLAVSSFASTHHDTEPTTLKGYVERMKDGQEDIYYLTGESRQSIENSPHMEAFRERGIEVLLLTDPVDEVWADAVGEYEGKKLRSVAKGQIDLDAKGEDTADDEREKQTEEYAGLLDWMKEQLDEDIKEVRLSSRLTVSPACVVSDAHDLTPALENMYRAMGQEVPRAKRILELNPDHQLVKGLNQAYKEREDRSALAETAELLHGLAVLAEGGQPKEPARFVKLMADRLERALKRGSAGKRRPAPVPGSHVRARAHAGSCAGRRRPARSRATNGTPGRTGPAERTNGRPDTSVDVVIAVNNLQLWPDIPAALAELHRVLRPGGRLLLSTHERWLPTDLTTLATTVEAAGFTSVRTWTWRPPTRSTPTAALLSAVRG